MDKQISHTILEVCKELGITYHSINPNYIEFTNDAQELAQLYKDLKTIAAKIQEISERHQINGINQLLSDDIAILDKVEHDLVKLANKLKNA